MTYAQPIQVRWSDYDVSGHVNNVAFLTYLEHARTMMLAELIGPDVYLRPHQVVRAQSIEYSRPVTLADSPVEVFISRRRLGATSYTLDYRVVSAAGEHATAICTVVTIDPVTGSPTALPQRLRAGLQALGALQDEDAPGSTGQPVLR